MDIYKENILYHYHHPKNYGRLVEKTDSVSLSNPLCGDEIVVDVVVRKGKLEKIGYQIKGCIISKASASMFFQFIKGKKLTKIKEIKEKDVLKLLGIKLGINRIKCALLPFLALKKLMRT